MDSERESAFDTFGPATAVRRNLVNLDPKADLLKIARWQRLLILLTVALVVSHATAMMVPFRGMGPMSRLISEHVLFTVLLSTSFTMLMLAWAMGVRRAAMALLTTMILTPGVNLVMLYVLLIEASAFLRFVGVHVGWFGASRESVEFAMRTPLCRVCGYNLTGNVSGRCPECGQRLSPIPSTTDPL